MVLQRQCGVSGKAADALVTLVQSCYPTAGVLFTSVAHSATTTSVGNIHLPGTFDALLTVLHIREAQRQGRRVDTLGCQRVLARRNIVPAGPAGNAAWSWWALLYAADAVDSPFSGVCGQPSPSSRVPCVGRPILCCPDAIVYIGGVETLDVMRAVVPKLVEAVPAVETPRSTVGAASATHAAERPAPKYCRRKVDWTAIWTEKRCAMRGVDLLELSLPVPSDLSGCGADARERLLVSIANPDVTLADLQRQPHSGRRGPFRTAFGFSLPCLRGALPASVIRAVRVLRRWQQHVVSCTPSASAFWVSSLGHLLEAAVGDPASPLTQRAEACRRQRRKLGLSEMEVHHLSAIVRPGTAHASTAELPPGAATKLLTFLLASTVLQLASTSPPETWNSRNYFLPAERLDDTMDAEVLRRTMSGESDIHLTFPVFSSLYPASQGDEHSPSSEPPP
ncbi:hypothetical protein LSCM1_03413 [Leishmania martiniquensis]|uniref:Uncharacterized protein n=1 Tax=Leishmania martiniquensis TaxID=1580590 RepID=A0A836HEC2_9TRYP|nr:hypothetical protein LSCM1_03413 [Leishmania martiniquensis]